MCRVAVLQIECIIAANYGSLNHNASPALSTAFSERMQTGCNPNNLATPTINFIHRLRLYLPLLGDCSLPLSPLGDRRGGDLSFSRLFFLPFSPSLSSLLRLREDFRSLPPSLFLPTSSRDLESDDGDLFLLRLSPSPLSRFLMSLPRSGSQPSLTWLSLLCRRRPSPSRPLPLLPSPSSPSAWSLCCRL